MSTVSDEPLTLEWLKRTIAMGIPRFGLGQDRHELQVAAKELRVGNRDVAVAHLIALVERAQQQNEWLTVAAASLLIGEDHYLNVAYAALEHQRLEREWHSGAVLLLLCQRLAMSERVSTQEGVCLLQGALCLARERGLEDVIPTLVQRTLLAAENAPNIGD